MPARHIVWCWCIHSLSPNVIMRNRAVCTCTSLLSSKINIKVNSFFLYFTQFHFSRKSFQSSQSFCHSVRVLSRSMLYRKMNDLSNESRWNEMLSTIEPKRGKTKFERIRPFGWIIIIIIIKSRIRFSLCLDLHKLMKQSYSHLI